MAFGGVTFRLSILCLNNKPPDVKEMPRCFRNRLNTNTILWSSIVSWVTDVILWSLFHCRSFVFHLDIPLSITSSKRKSTTTIKKGTVVEARVWIHARARHTNPPPCRPLSLLLLLPPAARQSPSYRTAISIRKILKKTAKKIKFARKKRVDKKGRGSTAAI